MNKRRIVNWFTYTIFCALLPTVITLMVRNIIITEELPAYSYAGELLMFTVMVTATSLGDIKDLRAEVGADIFLDIFFSAMLLFLIASAILYGCSVLSENTGMQIIDMKDKGLKISICISVICALLGTIIQIIIAKSEGD